MIISLQTVTITDILWRFKDYSQLIGENNWSCLLGNNEVGYYGFRNNKNMNIDKYGLILLYYIINNIEYLLKNEHKISIEYNDICKMFCIEEVKKIESNLKNACSQLNNFIIMLFGIESKIIENFNDNEIIVGEWIEYIDYINIEAILNYNDFIKNKDNRPKGIELLYYNLVDKNKDLILN